MSSKSFERLDAHLIAHNHCREAPYENARLLMMLMARIWSASFWCVMPCPGTEHAPRCFDHTVLLFPNFPPLSGALTHESAACR